MFTTDPLKGSIFCLSFYLNFYLGCNCKFDRNCFGGFLPKYDRSRDCLYITIYTYPVMRLLTILPLYFY